MNHVGTYPIETARLRLRRIEPRDAKDIFQAFSDERTLKYTRIPRYVDVQMAEEYVARAMALYDRPDRYYWIIERQSDGRFVGSVEIHTLSESDEVAEVGYAVTPEMWGNGYMSEALRAVLEFAFREVGYNRIEAGHSTQNPASGAVLRKVGMMYEGMMRERFKNAYGYHDTHQYAMLKHDL